MNIFTQVFVQTFIFLVVNIQEQNCWVIWQAYIQPYEKMTHFPKEMVPIYVFQPSQEEFVSAHSCQHLTPACCHSDKCVVPKCTVSVCISMMTNGIKHLFVYLLDFSSIYSKSLAHFFIRLSSCSVLRVFIVDRSPLSVVCVADIFLQSEFFLMMFFEEKKFVVLAKLIYEKFFYNLLFVFYTVTFSHPRFMKIFFQCCQILSIQICDFNFAWYKVEITVHFFQNVYPPQNPLVRLFFPH